MISDQDSTFKLIQKLWLHLSARRRMQLGLLMFVMLASAVTELLSLGAVLPLMSVFNEPQQLWKNKIVQEISTTLGYTSANQLLLPVILLFVAAAILAAFVRLSNLWLNGRMAAAVGSDLSCEGYKRTLYQPYEVHLRRNSAKVITDTTTQINLTVVALRSSLQLVTSSAVAAGLLIGLVLIDAEVAVAAMALFGGAYGVLGLTARRELRSNGQKIAEAAGMQLKALQEGLGSIRDVLLDGSQESYLKIYRQADRPQRQLQAKNVFLGAFPRYSLEALSMVGIAVLGGLLILQRGSSSSVIPLLGALAMGAQRMLPALQQVYSSWANLKSFNAALAAVLEMVSQPIPPHFDAVEPLEFHSSVRLENISFGYMQGEPEVLKDVSLNILRGERIGLIGPSGSGKSTLVDIVMGLLSPSQGHLVVDGKEIDSTIDPKRLIAWRAAIAHVPQNMYLSDSSITENIAYGVPSEQIDLELVKHAAVQAQIDSFIESTAEGYKSMVGERGICLSGGQRQRIGIARAIYKNAKVLILDEATSSLDNNTEEAVMSSIENLSKELTIIMIAHRLSTLKRCDRVLRMEDGKLVQEDIFKN